MDLFILTLLAALAALGAARGGGESACRLAGLVVAYAVAVHMAVSVGPSLAEKVGIASWAGSVALGTAGFLVAGLTCGALAGIVGRRERDVPGGLSPASRAVGGLLGAGRGLLLALPLLWLADLAGGARGVLGDSIPLPDLQGARAPAASGALLEAGTRVFLDPTDPAQRLLGRWVARPGQATHGLHEMLQHPRLVALQQDAGFWIEVEAGNVDAALTRPSFVAAARDDEFRRRLAALGLIGGEAARDPEAFREEMAVTLERVAPRLQEVMRDPELQEMLQDPALRKQIEDGDTFALLERPELRNVIGRLVREERAAQ